MVRNPAVGPVREARKCGDAVSGDAPARKQPQERRQRRTGRQPLALGRDEMPRSKSLLGAEIGEQCFGLLALEGARCETAVAIPLKESGQDPFAESAALVVEDDPFLLRRGRAWAIRRRGDGAQTKARRASWVPLSAG
jgi:hypothetical protein